MAQLFSEKSFSQSPDIAVLQERIARLEAQLSQEQKEAAPEQRVEAAKQEISNYVQEVQQTPSFAPAKSTRDDTSDLKNKSRAEQLGALVKLALSDGLDKAIGVANGLNNPAILDELHDTLVDSYFNQLVQMGVIKLL